MSFLISFLVGQTIVGGQGPASAGDLSRYYNRNREVTFTGTVTGKTKGQAPGYAQGVSILVKSGKTLREVELGPAWYVGRQQASVGLGQKVTVTGVPLTLDRRQRVILARQITRGRSVLALRDRSGMPYWTARRSGTVAMSGAAQRMDRRFQGTVGNATTFTVNGEEYAGYVVNTPDGPMNVAVAPSWYWNNQPSTFNAGDQVTLYGNSYAGGGSARVNTPGSLNGGVFLLNSATYSGGTFLLRPGGFPVYGGFQNSGGLGGLGGGATVIRP